MFIMFSEHCSHITFMSVITRWIVLNKTGRTTNQCFACCETIRFVDRRYSRFRKLALSLPENKTDRGRIIAHAYSSNKLANTKYISPFSCCRGRGLATLVSMEIQMIVDIQIDVLSTNEWSMCYFAVWIWIHVRHSSHACEERMIQVGELYGKY